jgi:hypothetical protein
MERVGEMESLQEIIADGRTDTAKAHEKTAQRSFTACRLTRGGETPPQICHADVMANKQTKLESVKTTEWRIGQPLDSPQAHSGPLRESVNEPGRSQFDSKRQKHKKK